MVYSEMLPRLHTVLRRLCCIFQPGILVALSQQAAGSLAFRISA
jgi:hypothetical protein